MSRELIRDRFPSVYSALRLLRRQVMLHFVSHERVFTKIYRDKVWGESCESASGSGSTLDATTQIREQLPALLDRLAAITFLDIPCGDFHWMQHVDLRNVRYFGADVVKELVNTNQSRFGSEFRRFLCLDITRDELPTVDLVLCRDVFVHFPYRDIIRAVRNIKKSKCRYMLTTTFPAHQENQEITTGSWRPLNLQSPPFGFDPPLVQIHDGVTGGEFADKSLGLWSVADLPDFGS